jgi:acetoin utilization deacetylase AcuC-like enzyme
MSGRRATFVVEDARFREHRTPDGHPECPERLEAVHEALAARAGALSPLPARPAESEEILRVHSPAHLAQVERAAGRAPAALDADTFVSRESFEVARLAAGSCVDLALRVAQEPGTSGFAALRPPGHHAEATGPMGFCLFNNVAIAARALQSELGVGRILILDWDVHHGNGTQHAFEEDPTVLYLSTHQFPYYPGTGAAHETGRGRGEGYTVNVPLPAGCGDEEYLAALQRVLVPVTEVFRPECLLVSCGFDAHRDDPLAQMRVSREGYLAMSALVRALADAHCDGRAAFFLEGGYAPSGLREGTGALLDALTPERAFPPPPTVALERAPRLHGVLARVAAAHGARWPGVGAA